MNFKNGTKNNWRNWLWNRIEEELAREALDRNGRILFLAGEQALDVPVALRHGFRREQLVAVEKDASTAAALREKRVAVVRGRLSTVMACWPTSQPVSAIVADYCGGITAEVVNTLRAYVTYAPFASAVLAINVLRGRDDAAIVSSTKTFLQRTDTSRCPILYALFSQVACDHLGKCAASNAQVMRYLFSGLRGEVDVDDHELGLLRSEANRLHGVAHASYRSGKLIYDSCVFYPPRVWTRGDWPRATAVRAADGAALTRQAIAACAVATRHATYN